MDWHHPDYLPRRDWEKDTARRRTPNFDRYVDYMKAQLKELLDQLRRRSASSGSTASGNRPGPTSTGADLYAYVRGAPAGHHHQQPRRQGPQRHGGLTRAEYAGDFGTPEQEIPATGLPGVDWESCMTMNDTWGYNKDDQQLEVDRDAGPQPDRHRVSKGGNYLLNVGPDRRRPDSRRRASSGWRRSGRWMKVNGESIYGTAASPFAKLAWGRCTRKTLPRQHPALPARLRLAGRRAGSSSPAC